MKNSQGCQETLYLDKLASGHYRGLYSSSTKDVCRQVAYFLVFQKIRDPPKVTKYLVNDSLERGHAP